MAVHEVPLLAREIVADGTMAFHFAKPTGFTARAGQSLLVRLIDPPETDAEGDARSFSIASAPLEPNLMIATRMRNTAFKRVLKTIPLGTRVTIDGPDGQLVLPENPTAPAVFLAGGIGITPFRAMLVQAARDRWPNSIYLFYSNRRPEHAAFLGELEELQETNRNYHLIATMTEAHKSCQGWSGGTSRIQRDMLERHMQDIRSPIYYFAGPPAMTTAMRKLLEDIGIDEQAMRYEEFYGY